MRLHLSVARGMTLLEVMIAVAILCAGILMMVATFSQGGRLNQELNNQAIAYLAANRKLEEFRLACAKDFYTAERRYNHNPGDDFDETAASPRAPVDGLFNWSFKEPNTGTTYIFPPCYFYVPELDHSRVAIDRSFPQGEIAIGMFSSDLVTATAFDIQPWTPVAAAPPSAYPCFVAESPHEALYGNLSFGTNYWNRLTHVKGSTAQMDGVDMNGGDTAQYWNGSALVTNHATNGDRDGYNDAVAYQVDIDANRAFNNVYYYDTGAKRYKRANVTVPMSSGFALSSVVDCDDEVPQGAVHIYLWPCCIRIRWGARDPKLTSEIAPFSEVSIRTFIGRPAP